MNMTIVERRYTMRIATETYMTGNQLQNKKKDTKDIIIEKSIHKKGIQVQQ